MHETVATATTPKQHPCRKFDRILSEYINLQQSMLTCLHRQHEAMRRGDATQMESCAQEQQALAATLMTLDERRLDSVRALIAELGLESTTAGRTAKAAQATAEQALPATMTELIEHLPADLAEPVREKTKRLRELTNAVRRQGEVVRKTAENLLGHVSGLIQRINRLVNVTGLYQPDGRIDPNPTVTSNRVLDVRH
ncbi:MAG: flagellar protein FlgN [Planctomycetes bacterium]|nr:flagellar protein FlgN [Planctomycetota bacterium]NOG53516.1 flagellar protein FlgN [Planctomycetota bacterium]